MKINSGGLYFPLDEAAFGTILEDEQGNYIVSIQSFEHTQTSEIICGIYLQSGKLVSHVTKVKLFKGEMTISNEEN